MEAYLETMRERLNSGEKKDHLQKHFLYCHHWSDEKWKSMARGGGGKNGFQYCSDSSGTILYFRSLQGHSGRSLIDPSLQDNVIILNDFFMYIYHVGYAINLHSIINSGLIPGGQNFEQQTDSILSFCLWILTRSTWKHRVLHNTCTQSMEETSKYGVLGRHQSCSEERIEVLSNTIERNR